jgi:hypothetical protein
LDGLLKILSEEEVQENIATLQYVKVYDTGEIMQEMAESHEALRFKYKLYKALTIALGAALLMIATR